MSDEQVVTAEVKSARPLEEVQKDYATSCAQLGEKVFHSALVQQEINNLHQKISLLNQEASELKRAEVVSG